MTKAGPSGSLKKLVEKEDQAGERGERSRLLTAVMAPRAMHWRCSDMVSGLLAS